MIEKANIPSQNNKPVKYKSDNKTITNGYAEIDSLVRKCWQKGSSLRQLSAILRTQRYDTCYGVLIRSKVIECCSRSRPTLNEQETIAEISRDILDAMSCKKISVRRWCKTYGFEPGDLWFLHNPDGSDSDILCYLKEDFPELFGATFQEYISSPIFSDRKGFSGGKKGHVYWSNYLGIRVEHKTESEAIRIYNWRVYLVVVKRRMQLLFSDGIEAALAWPGSHFARKTGSNNVIKKASPLTKEQQSEQQILLDKMRLSSEVNKLFLELLSTEKSKSLELIDRNMKNREKLVKKFGISIEQIDSIISTMRK